MNTRLRFPLIASVVTIILMYIIGFKANIELLVFKVSLSQTEISFLPIIAGLLVGFISIRIIKLNSR